MLSPSPATMKSACKTIATKPNKSDIKIAARTAQLKARTTSPVASPTAMATNAATSIIPSTATFKMLARVVIIAAKAARSMGVVWSSAEAKNREACMALHCDRAAARPSGHEQDEEAGQKPDD